MLQSINMIKKRKETGDTVVFNKNSKWYIIMYCSVMT